MYTYIFAFAFYVFSRRFCPKRYNPEEHITNICAVEESTRDKCSCSKNLIRLFHDQKCNIKNDKHSRGHTEASGL